MDLDIVQLRDNALFFDQRLTRLRLVIEGLSKAAKHIQEQELSIDWWQTMNEKLEFESIYRLAVIAFADYINNTIKLLFDETDRYSQFYKLDACVELIIALESIANYHENIDPKTLSDFNLNIDNHPLFNGIAILDEGRNLEQIIPILEKWRIKLVHLRYPTTDR